MIAHTMPRRHVAVVGGGISGLAAAFWLRQEGCKVSLLESTGRTGGLIRSERYRGYLIDHAAHCLVNFLPQVNHLIETVGLAEERMIGPSGETRYMLKDGRPQAVPLSLHSMLTSSFWSWSAKFRLAVEPFIPPARAGVEETVADFVRRRFGREWLEQAVEPLVAGMLAGDPHRACVQSVMPKLYEMEQRYGSIIRGMLASRVRGSRSRYPRQLLTFTHGMESLPAAIARCLGDAVRTGVRVEAVERCGRQWSLALASGRGMEEIRTDAVVIATPAAAAARLLAPLSRVLAAQLRGIPYAPLAVVAMGFQASTVRRPADGMGCLIPEREKKRILGVFWGSAPLAVRATAGRVLLSCYVGGLRHPELLEMDDEDLSALVMHDLRGILGLHGEAEFVRVIRHGAGLPQYHLGHRQRLATIAAQLRLLPGLYLCGNYLDGVSVCDRIDASRKLVTRMGRELSSQDRSPRARMPWRPDEGIAPAKLHAGMRRGS